MHRTLGVHWAAGNAKLKTAPSTKLPHIPNLNDFVATKWCYGTRIRSNDVNFADSLSFSIRRRIVVEKLGYNQFGRYFLLGIDKNWVSFRFEWFSWGYSFMYTRFHNWLGNYAYCSVNKDFCQQQQFICFHKRRTFSFDIFFMMIKYKKTRL